MHICRRERERERGVEREREKVVVVVEVDPPFVFFAPTILVAAISSSPGRLFQSIPSINFVWCFIPHLFHLPTSMVDLIHQVFHPKNLSVRSIPFRCWVCVNVNVNVNVNVGYACVGVER